MLRRLVRAALAVALLLTAVQASTFATSVEARSTSCAPDGARVLSAAGKARLYSATGTLYACRGSSSRRRIGDLPSGAPTGSSGYEEVGHPRLQPRWVAWASVDNRASTGDSYYTVAVRSLAGDARSRSFPTGQEGCTPSCPSGRGIGPVTQLKLDRVGSIAWIAQVTQGGSVSGREVWVAPHGSAARRVAVGSDVNRLSLVLARGVVTWRQGGNLKSSRF